MESLIAVIAVLILFAAVAYFNKPAPEPEPEPIRPWYDTSSLFPSWGTFGFPKQPTIIASPQYAQMIQAEARQQEPDNIIGPVYGVRVISSPVLKGDQAYLINHEEMNRRIADSFRDYIDQILRSGDAAQRGDESEGG